MLASLTPLPVERGQIMAMTLEDAARRSSHRQRALYRLWFALDYAEVTQG